eukprot:COSAG05_NODE_1347_length_5118_cov_5.195258_6_plen_143_part_00
MPGNAVYSNGLLSIVELKELPSRGAEGDAAEQAGSHTCLAARRDKEPRGVGHGLLAVLLQHELADVDAHPVLLDFRRRGIQPPPQAKHVLEALARPVVPGTGGVTVVVVVRCAVGRQRVWERLVLHQLDLRRVFGVPECVHS